ncbi:MAG: PQQ-dependent sugar dehydrogenase [Planctomycetota bacterium]
MPPAARLPVRPIMALALAVFASGCQRPSASTGDARAASRHGGTATPRVRWPRPPAPRLQFPLRGGPPTLQVEPAFPNLSFPQALDLASPRDGSDRVFVATKAGRIHVFANRDDVNTSRVFLDISARVHNWFEVGLLGLTFDPNYATNGFFYVHYVDTAFDSHVSRFTASSTDPDRADPNSEVELLRVRQPEGNHNGGALQFGPDGFLYVVFGDGGGLDDQYGNSQNLNTLHGSMLRIDPHHPSGGRNYGIPGDNPYVGVAGRDEIFAHGLRSPWRFSIDPVTGRIWLGDVGQDHHDELDLIRRGGNYGWPVYEGPRSHRNPTNRPPTDFDEPLHTDVRGEMRSIIGGYVYRGRRLPSLVGDYVFGDNVYGAVWALTEAGGQVTKRRVGHVPNIASFGLDAQGEVYVVSFDGTLHRLVERPGQAAFPPTLSATGLMLDTAHAAWTAGLIPYQVNSPLWSDHATKTRFFTVPDRTTIGFHPTEAWTLPVGSVLVKHFEMLMDLSDPTSLRRLETRVFVHQETGWLGGTYRWNAAQTDAALVTARAQETLTVRDPTEAGGVRVQTWTYPSSSDCTLCHTTAAGHVLGLSTLQCNRPLSTSATNQLDLLAGMGYFDQNIGPSDHYAHLLDPLLEQGSLGAFARSYLAANCAHCHRPGGALQGSIDLRFTTHDAHTGLLWVRPTRGGLTASDPYLVKPRDPANSVLLHRMVLRDGNRMPLLGSDVVDAYGVQLVDAWIRGM